jgi:hypothetical protein
MTWVWERRWAKAKGRWALGVRCISRQRASDGSRHMVAEAPSDCRMRFIQSGLGVYTAMRGSFFLSSSSIAVFWSIAKLTMSECFRHTAPIIVQNWSCWDRSLGVMEGKRVVYCVRYDTPFSVCLGLTFSSFSIARCTGKLEAR